MTRSFGAATSAQRSDAGASMVEVGFQLVAAIALVALVFIAFNRVVAVAGAGPQGNVPLEQCIEHQSCAAAAAAHSFK